MERKLNKEVVRLSNWRKATSRLGIELEEVGAGPSLGISKEKEKDIKEQQQEQRKSEDT